MRMVEKVHRELALCLRSGDLAIDATAGNGHDAAFLADLVGDSGKVYAFDLQPAAIEATNKRLVQAGLLDRCVLHQAGHERMEDILPPESRGRIRAIVFNLGYLPGSDKTVATTVENTLLALEVALVWLAPDGLLTVTAYRGHPGGMREAQEVEERFANLDAEFFLVAAERASSDPTSPILFLVRKRNQA